MGWWSRLGEGASHGDAKCKKCKKIIGNQLKINENHQFFHNFWNMIQWYWVYIVWMNMNLVDSIGFYDIFHTFLDGIRWVCVPPSSPGILGIAEKNIGFLCRRWTPFRHCAEACSLATRVIPMDSFERNGTKLFYYLYLSKTTSRRF